MPAQKKIIDTNSKLVENQNKLLEQNRLHEDDKVDLKKRIDELEGQLSQHVSEEVKSLQAEIRQHRERIELTADMDDAALMAWLDQEMEKTRLYTDTNLTLKTLANTLGPQTARLQMNRPLLTSTMATSSSTARERCKSWT